MYYKVINNNKEKWIVLLHCICANMHIFDNHIKQLNEKYNVLLIDLPGHGKSKDYEGKIGFEEVAYEITKIVNELEITTFSIWGISLGGVIAKYLLKLVPDRIEKIVFEGPAFGLENRMYKLLFNIFNKIKYILPKKMYLKAFVFAVIPGKSRKTIRNQIYEHLKISDYKKLSVWLTKLCEEFKNNDYTLLNEAKVNKVYILGEEDYIFKNATLKNINENKYNSIIIKKKSCHLCHLQTRMEL